MIKFKNLFEPLHFLNALGAGGISITFFMYLMFLTKHPNTPVPTFESLNLAYTSSNFTLKLMILIAILGMLIFALYHLINVFISTKEYFIFKKSENYKQIKENNSEVQLMAIPLTYAMTMNVLFSLLVVLVPNLWKSIENIFPFAILGFIIIGFYSLKMLINYYKRLFHTGSFNFEQNNNLSQLLSVFSLAMVGVGLSGPAVMTHNKITAVIALIFSIAIFAVAITLFVTKFILGMKSALKQGWSFENSPSIWIIIPFLTLFGIALIRYQHAFHALFGTEIDKSKLFIITTSFVALQIFFGILGYLFMEENGYFKKYTKGEDVSTGSLALICPMVAMVVLGFFFIHRGLVDNGILEKFNIIYFILLSLYILIQIKTIVIYYKLNKKLTH